MKEIRKTELFAGWLDALRDIRARARIQARIQRLAEGNAGDAGAVGDKSSQAKDIKAALCLARNLPEELQ